MEAYLLRMQKDLYAGPQALVARDFLFKGVARKPEDRIVYTVISAAGVSILPRWARSPYRIPTVSLVDAAVTPPTRLLCAGLRWVVPPRR